VSDLIIGGEATDTVNVGDIIATTSDDLTAFITNNNGTYSIDVDGAGPGKAPVFVVSDFTGAVTFTADGLLDGI
jgi:hypothetical protein